MALSLRNVALQKNVALLKCIKTRSVVTSANKNQSPPPISATNKNIQFKGCGRELPHSLKRKRHTRTVAAGFAPCPAFKWPVRQSVEALHDGWLKSRLAPNLMIKRTHTALAAVRPSSLPNPDTCPVSGKTMSTRPNPSSDVVDCKAYHMLPCTVMLSECLSCAVCTSEPYRVCTLCVCNLPPPCNTPPMYLQHKTGYYYYPYGYGPFQGNIGNAPVNVCSANCSNPPTVCKCRCPYCPCGPCKACCCCGVLNCNRSTSSGSQDERRGLRPSQPHNACGVDSQWTGIPVSVLGETAPQKVVSLDKIDCAIKPQLIEDHVPCKFAKPKCHQVKSAIKKLGPDGTDWNDVVRKYPFRNTSAALCHIKKSPVKYCNYQNFIIKHSKM